MSERVQPQDEWVEELDLSGRRISDSLDLEAIARETGSVPECVDAGATARLIASHWAKIDRLAAKPSIIKRVTKRMAEHCDLVRVQLALRADHEVVFCPGKQEFFAYRSSVKLRQPPNS